MPLALFFLIGPAVLTHPPYPVSKPHRCLLTLVGARRGGSLLETINVLYAHATQHQIETKRGYLLPDGYFHLNPRGHAVMPEALARFPVDEGLEPPRNL